jgi:hypothetical protein
VFATLPCLIRHCQPLLLVSILLHDWLGARWWVWLAGSCLGLVLVKAYSHISFDLILVEASEQCADLILVKVLKIVIATECSEGGAPAPLQ